MMINNTERTSVSCSALEPESEESSSQNSVPDVLEFQPHSNMPVMPPEWREREEKRKAEEAMRNTQGITIRRRPPTGPPLHNVGPFQFKIQSEGNTPRNILEEIVWHKDCEIAQMKERTPLTALAKAMAGVAPTKDFVGTLKARAAETERPALIAEVKKASPSRGLIQQNFDPVVNLFI
jgi:indole-3-glycerol phosphate synthase